MQTIFAKLLYEMEKGRDTVLTTIVWESGSAPRGAGAQMLVDAQGPRRAPSAAAMWKIFPSFTPGSF